MWVPKKMVKKISVQKKNFGKKIWVKKRNFWCGKILCPKTFLFQKNWVKKKSVTLEIMPIWTNVAWAYVS